jgi:hypothetical protein
LSKHSLAANDNNLGRAGDTGCGPNDMLKLCALHGGIVASLPRLRAPLKFLQTVNSAARIDGAI